MRRGKGINDIRRAKGIPKKTSKGIINKDLNTLNLINHIDFNGSQQ